MSFMQFVVPFHLLRTMMTTVAFYLCCSYALDDRHNFMIIS